MTAISRRSRPRPTVPTKWLTIALFVLPALVLYAVFVILPVLQAMQYSLYKWNGLSPLTDFVGLQNYVTAFGSKPFMTSVGNNVLIVVLSLFIQIPFTWPSRSCSIGASAVGRSSACFSSCRMSSPRR